MDENKTETASTARGYESPHGKKGIVVSAKTAIIVAVLVIIAALGFVYKGLFIAATVNGSPISRLAVIKRLESSSGSQVLDALITEKLIEGALDKNGIIAPDEEVDAKIKTIEEQVTARGTTFEQALAAEGTTRVKLKKQVATQLRVEKMFYDKTQISDEEAAKYIKDNKVAIPKGQEVQIKEEIKNQLKSGKLNQEARAWIDSLRASASINYFAKY